MKSVNTFCRICEPLCPLIADVDGDRVVKLRPNRDHPVYRGFCCNKGLTMNEVHVDPDRLMRPLKRINPRNELPAKFEPISWETAIAEISQKFASAHHVSPNAIAVCRGNPLSFNSVSVRALAKFATKLGTKMCFGPTTQDCSNKMAASQHLYGAEMLHPIPDLEFTDYFLNFGSNPKVSKMSLFHTPHPNERIRDIVTRGGKVLHINSRHIESATPATGDILLVKPDTDIYLIAALLHEVYITAGFNTELIDAHAINIQGLISFIARYSPERVSDVVGVDALVIKTIARDFAAAKSASVYMSTGVNMGRQGTLAYWLLQMLSLVTGNLGSRGGNIVSKGYIPPIRLGIESAADPYFDTPIGRLRHFAGCLPGNVLADLITGEDNPIRALLVVCGNPVLSIAGEERFRTALQKLDVLVCIDIYPSATTEHADYVLPGVDMLERRDLNLVNNGFQPQPFAQYTDAVVTPLGERREEWWILAKLEQAMGLPSLLDEEDPDPFHEVDSLIANAGFSIAQLKVAPHHTIVLPSPNPADTFSDGLRTTEHKIDCCPEAFREALAQAEIIFEALHNEPADQLKLIGRRTIHMHNSWMSNLEIINRGSDMINPLWMNPDDARRRGLNDGETIRISNENGGLVTRLRFDDTLRPGVVAMTHGGGNARTPNMRVANAKPGVNVNQLLPHGPGSYDALSNQAFMTGIPVNVQAEN